MLLFLAHGFQNKREPQDAMPSLTTIFARTGHALPSKVQSLPIPPNSSVLYAVSANNDQDSIVSMVSHLGQNKNCIGCLSRSPFQSIVSCAVATFPESTAVPFTSSIPGKASIALGKLRRPDKSDGPFDHASQTQEGFQRDLRRIMDGWKGKPVSSNDPPSTDQPLPDELQDIKLSK